MTRHIRELFGPPKTHCIVRQTASSIASTSLQWQGICIYRESRLFASFYGNKSSKWTSLPQVRIGKVEHLVTLVICTEDDLGMCFDGHVVYLWLFHSHHGCLQLSDLMWRSLEFHT